MASGKGAPRGRRLAAAGCAALALLLALLVATQPAAAGVIDLDNYAGRLHWQLDTDENHVDAGSEAGTYVYYYRLVDADGNPVTAIRVNGREISLDKNHKLMSGGWTEGVWTYMVGTPSSRPSALTAANRAASELGLSNLSYNSTEQAAAKNKLVSLVDTGQTDNGGTGEGGTAEEASVWDRYKANKVNDDMPVVNITDLAGSLMLVVVKSAYTFLIAPLLHMAADLCQFMLSVVDPSSLFSADFKTGSFSRLFDIAKQVNDAVAVPYGTAFLGVVFALQLLEPGRSRGHMPTEQWLDTTFRQLALLLLAWTMITHAMDIVYGIYWLGTNLSQFISSRILTDTFLTGAAQMGADIHELIYSRVDNCTYEQFGGMVGLLVGAGMLVMTVYRCVVKIFTISFLRMGEVYLRAAFAAIPFSFIAGERARMVGVNYVKRYAAVCFQAAVIVVSLSFMGILFSICGALVGAAIDAAALPATAGFFTQLVIDVVRVVVPAAIGLGVATAIVEKSESLANSLFGLA